MGALGVLIFTQSEDEATGLTHTKPLSECPQTHFSCMLLTSHSGKAVCAINYLFIKKLLEIG